MLVRDRVPFVNSQLWEQVNNARMVVNPLWRGLGNTPGFVLDGKSYRQGWATALQVTTLNEGLLPGKEPSDTADRERIGCIIPVRTLVPRLSQ